MLTKTLSTYRSAYSGLSRSTWLLSFVMLVNRSGTMVVPFLTLYLTSAEMGFSLSKAGIVFGLFGAGATIGAFFGGRLTDRIGFYPVQLITLIGGGILFILLGQMKTYPLICLLTFLVSFVNEAFRPANSVAIAHYSREDNRTRSYALNRLAINLGWALGSALGGIIAAFNYELLFWIDGFTNIGAALLMVVFIKNPKSMAERPKETTPSIGKTSAYKDGLYLRFIFLTILFAACFFQIFTNFSVYCKKVLNFSEAYIGMLMAINGVLIALVEMVMVHKLESRKRNMYYITVGVLLTSLFYLALVFLDVGHVLAIFLIILITFGEMLAMPFMNTFWISRSKAENRGQYAALYTMAWSLAQTLGPMLGAQLADGAGFNTLWWIVGGICLLATVGFGYLKRM